MKYLHELKLNSITEAGNDRFIVSFLSSDQKSRRVLVDGLGRVVSEEYRDISKRMFDDCYDVETDDYKTKIVLNNDGKVIYFGKEKVHSFSDDVAVLEDRKTKKTCWIDKTGRVFGTQFCSVSSFVNNSGVVKLDNGKYCLVDRNMQIISPEFDYLHPYFNPNYTFAVIDEKVVIIDRNFNICCDKITDENGNTQPFENILFIDENNIIWHMSESGENKYCYVDTSGKKLGQDHEFIHGFSEGISRVQDKDGTRYVDLSGKYITDRSFVNASNFCGGYAIVGDFDNNGEHIFAYLKKDGTYLKLKSKYLQTHPNVSDTWFAVTGEFHEKHAWVNIKGNSRQIIDDNGNVLNGMYYWLGAFCSGLAKHEKKNGKWTFVNLQSENFESEFDSANDFVGDFAVIKNNGIYDAVKTNELLLSEISSIAHQIEVNPRNVLNIPEKFFKDEKLVERLFEHSLDCAAAAGDQEYLHDTKRYTDFLTKKLEYKSENLENGKRRFYCE